MSEYTLNTKARAQKGRSASRRLRKANCIPAILYGKHTKPEGLAVDTPEFTRLLKAVAGRAVLVELNIEGRNEKALSFLQEIQRDPITDRFLHVDFQEVKADEKIEIDVPVRSKGESVGVKSQNGVLEILAHELRVRCLPKDLPAIIEVDVTELEVGEVIKVSELPVIAGVEFLDHKGHPVISCVEPVEEVASAAAPTAAAAAPAAGAATPAAAPAGEAAKAPAAASAKK
ncbi:MAG: 50S ribosomal protein L25 [Opitutaceae bacterium]|jgi:large subunit ribosomal protein L25|nr:50S ribosomal protein L25 [Opitutaceae bacterium]